MAEYHVGCGAFGIYAGTLEPNQEYEAIKKAWDKAIKAWNRRMKDDARDI